MHLPWHARYECIRLAAWYGIATYSLTGWSPEHLLSRSSLDEAIYKRAGSPPKFPRPPRSSPEVWDLAARDSDTVILSGQLQFADHKSPSPFSLRLLPLDADPKSNRFARKFGANRFLKIFAPSFNGLPRHLPRDRMLERFQEWLLVPNKNLMGYTWDVFHAKPTEKTQKQAHKSERFSEPGEVGGHEIVLFATSGPGLGNMCLRELLDWFMPLELNQNLPSCKAYARLKLGFSKTYGTISLSPEQVKEVPDKFGDGTPEDSSLKDGSFEWTLSSGPSQPRVMNDGCSRMSPRAAELVWESLRRDGHVPNSSRLSDRVPSAFQARIGPAKGVWMPDYHNYDRNNQEVWIELTPKQLKFARHSEDRNLAFYDPFRLTFEVNDWATKSCLSTLYLDYLPILEDRGVSRQILRDFVRNTIQAQREPLQNALDHPLKLRYWLQENFDFITDNPNVVSSSWIGQRQKGPADRVKKLLESGFNPRNLKYLAENVINLISTRLSIAANSMKVHLPCSTYVLGIADPVGCLKPDEIHIMFTEPELVGGAPFLDNIDALVSRHPALRSSDIQRVKAVFKRELEYIYDVVVFPVTGSYPLAAKLQGGDYDGDRFWLCWDAMIVERFRNAPPPVSSPTPEDYGVEVDRASCGDIWHGPEGLTAFFKRNFSFQWQEPYLGIATNYHERLRYSTNSLHSRCVEEVADVHDLLVDSAKDGYRFSGQAWKELIVRSHFPRRVVEPRYKKAESRGLFDDIPGEGPSAHIIDHLIFDVARVEARQMVEHIQEELLKDTCKGDETLRELYARIWREYDNDQKMLDTLNHLLNVGILKTFAPWREAAQKSKFYEERGKDSKSTWDECKMRCREEFESLQPTCSAPHAGTNGSFEHPVAKAWTQRAALHDHSLWSLIKASALYTKFSERPSFVFSVAGDELCFIKAFSVGKPDVIISEMSSMMKMRKRKSDVLDDVNETEAVAHANAAAEDVAEETECEADSEMNEDEEVQFHDAVEDIREMSQWFADSSLSVPDFEPADRPNGTSRGELDEDDIPEGAILA